MRDHKELDVWQAGVDLVTMVYKISHAFPKEELFGITSQMRRAAVYIPSNIAEGAARQTPKEFVQFLFVALGSAAELETQIIIANRLKYLEREDELLAKLASVRKMLHGLIRHYRSPNPPDA